MILSYFPGCTLKTKAKSLEISALASLAELGVVLEELPSWNCCGAVYSLAKDDLIHQLAPVRILMKARDQGSERLITICSMCYNTLARANLMMRQDEKRRKTINLFMEEEKDYAGEVEVVHLLSFLRDDIGWDRIREKTKRPLNHLKIAPYYGCTLHRPREVGIEPPGQVALMTALFEALGASVLDFAAADLCCGSYQTLVNPEAAENARDGILEEAMKIGAEALVLSCPLCDYNLRRKYRRDAGSESDRPALPILYFTQLLSYSLGLGTETCGFAGDDASFLKLLGREKAS